MKRLEYVPIAAALAAGTVMLFGVVQNVRAGLRPGESAPMLMGYEASYGDRPLQIVGLSEQRPAPAGGRVETAGEMYLLVVMAGDKVTARRSTSREEPPLVTTSDVWRVRGSTPGAGVFDRIYQMDYVYDRAHKTATVAGQVFPLAAGNLFVVHLGQQAQPRVTQVEGTFSSTRSGTSMRTLGARFAEALAPDDPVRRVVDPSSVKRPCPPERAKRHTGKPARVDRPASSPHPLHPSA